MKYVLATLLLVALTWLVIVEIKSLYVAIKNRKKDKKGGEK